MRKTDMLIGILIGIVTALTGSYLFVTLFINSNLSTAIAMVNANDQTGKIITLGAVLNLIVFFTLLHYKKDLMARGVILATILLAVATIFV